MTNIQQLIDKCSAIVSKWHDAYPTVELLEDFASVFDLSLNVQLVPLEEKTRAEPKKAEAAQPSQNALFEDFDLTPQDRSMLDMWRENNGLSNE